MHTQTTWHGTGEELVALSAALERCCSCRYALEGRQPCPSHKLLLDQQTLDRLLFARRIAERLRREEWATAAPSGVHEPPAAQRQRRV